ncbi:MAG: chemotaxis-specific protein-glutamate methyltransferase CheB [Candidatus Hydrogenedentes bacterium]|nr:chemotaxis-specific protein-glutamate methyltransferase CheB [Candidatus Hydrogenedentota bacterium]
MAEVLSSLPGVEVVGQAPNGKIAIQKVRELRPDLLTLDMEMPEMDGLAVLDALKAAGELPTVIVVSALTRHGGRLTMQALQKGAFDFITKPDTASAEQSREALRIELAPRLKALALRLGVRGILRGASPVASPAAAVPRETVTRETAPALGSVEHRMNRLVSAAKPELVLIGVSTGGPNALAAMLPSLPGNLGVPVLIVQHMPPVFTQSLAENLDAKCTLRVCEAADGMMAEANTVYIAPGGRQMRLAPGTEGRRTIQITDDPPENNCRPAVDYLFRSVANHFPGRAMGVILTGMGSDGTLGLRLLKRHGCFVIAQDEASCVVYGMPKAAVDAGVADAVLPLESIASRIASVVKGLGI